MAGAKERKTAIRLSRAKTSLMLLLAAVLNCLAAVLRVSGGGIGDAISKDDTWFCVGAVIYVLLVFLMFAGYMYSHQRKVYSDPKLMGIIAIQIAILPWLQIVCNMLSPYITPMLMGAMIISELINDRAGIAAAMLLAAMGALLAGGDELASSVSFVMLAANSVSGIAAIFALKKTNTRSSMIGASGAGGIAGGLITAVICLIRGAAIREILMASGCVLFSGLFSGLLVIGSLSIWENLFDIATDARLNELMNVNNPLLKQLLHDAPGTYQHSMNVAALAEGAAEKIGADHILAKVGAAYHDVGKLRRPQYYMENQQGKNIHDTLPPAESASIIISHQKDGATILAKHKMPGAVIRIAAEHHGNSLMSYFYHKAVSEGEVNPKAFRYTGNRPGTKESAIVMLADCCEAAVRSLGDCTVEARENMVHKVIWSKLTDGENMLSDAPVTMQDINDIEKSFLRTFAGIMHDRIEYPEDKKQQ